MTKPLVLTKTFVKPVVNDGTFQPCDVDSVTTRIKKAFGARLLELREAMGITMSDLAIESGVSRSHLSTAARSGNCQMLLLYQIRERTHVDLNWLISGVGEIDRAKLNHLSTAQRKALVKELEKERAARIAERTKHRTKLSPSGKVRSAPTKDEVVGRKGPARS